MSYNKLNYVLYVEQCRSFSDVIQCLLNNKVVKDSVLGKLNPFLDSNGMLRINTGKCENNVTLSYDSKYPLIIPNGHISELFIRHQHLFLKHAGLKHVLNTIRDKFWVIAGGRTAMKVICECPRCNRYDSRDIYANHPLRFLPYA